jgi:hypothetical protein
VLSRRLVGEEPGQLIVPTTLSIALDQSRLGEHHTDVDVPYRLHVMTRRIYSFFFLFLTDAGTWGPYVSAFRGDRNEIGNVMRDNRRIQYKSCQRCRQIFSILPAFGLWHIHCPWKSNSFYRHEKKTHCPLSIRVQVLCTLTAHLRILKHIGRKVTWWA